MTDSKDLIARIHGRALSVELATPAPPNDPLSKLLKEAADHIEALEAEVVRLREALGFYADKDNHKLRREPSYRDRFSQNMKPGRPKLGRVSEDKGKRARAALVAMAAPATEAKGSGQ